MGFSPILLGRRRFGEASLLEILGSTFYSTTSSDVANTKKGATTKPFQNDITSRESPQEKITDITILRTLAKYLWLKDNIEFRLRVFLALGLLVGSKVLNVQVPFLFKLAVDRLSTIASDGAIASSPVVNSPIFALMLSPIAVLVGYGIARAGASACNGWR